MNYKALLLVSLAVNLGLGVYAFRKFATRPGIPQTNGTVLATSSALKKVAFTNTVFTRLNWEAVESPDYREYIANLRTVGCPEETIHDIIVADVNKLYDKKKKQVRKEAPKWDYWVSINEFQQNAGREAWEKILKLDEQREAVLRALGLEPDPNFKGESKAKKQALQEFNELDLKFDFIQDDARKAEFLRLRNEVTKKTAMSDNHVAHAVEQEMHSAVKQLLTPDEAFQYDLRFTDTANNLHFRYLGFEPTEQEFLAVFKLRKAFYEEFEWNPMTRTSEGYAKYEAAEKQLLEQIKQTLGPERGADYEIAQDTVYKGTYLLTKKSGLGAQEAKELYSMRKRADEKAGQIRTNKSLTPEQRAAALQGIRQETEKSIQTVLGEKGWDGNDWWLDSIYQPNVQPGTGTSQSK